MLSEKEIGNLERALSLSVNELDNVLKERRTQWDIYIKQYKSIRENPNKSFPWPGCSNVFVPEIFNQIGSITSYILYSTLRQDPPIRIKAYQTNVGDDDVAQNLEHFLTFYLEVVVRHMDYWRAHLPYTILLGTHVMKQVFKPDNDLGWPIVHWQPVPLHRVYAYPGITDWRNAPLVGDAAYVPLHTIYELATDPNNGVMSAQDASEFVASLHKTYAQTDIFSETRVAPQGIPPNYGVVYELYILWTDPLKPWEKPKRYKVFYEHTRQKVLWVDVWDPESRLLPYEFVYWRRDEDCVFGVGLGDHAWTLQRALNTVTNQAVDNGTIANTRMWAVPPGANINEDEAVYPGRIFITPNPEKIRAWPGGDVSPAAWSVSSVFRQAIQYTAGVPEAFMGFPNTIQRTRATAQGQALDIQMTGNRFDLNISEFETGVENCIWHTIDELVMYAAGETVHYSLAYDEKSTLSDLLDGDFSGGLASALRARLTEDEASSVERIFTVPQTLLRRERFRIVLSRREVNQQIERTTMLMLSQVVSKYLADVTALAEKMAMLAQQLPNSPLITTLGDVWKASNAVMKRVLMAFPLEDAREILVQIGGFDGLINFGGTLAAGEAAGGNVGDENQAIRRPMGYDITGAGAFGITGAQAGVSGGRPSNTEIGELAE